MVLTIPGYSQYSTSSNSPDCYFTAILSTVTRSVTFDNRQLKCNVWKVQSTNLSNASSTFSLDSSGSGTTWNSEGETAVAATSHGSSIIVSSSNYISAIIRNKGTGNVIIAVSGFAYGKGRNANSAAVPKNVTYTIVNDVASATITYTGKAKSIFDPVTNTTYAMYQIMKLTSDGSANMTSVQYADGDSEEDNIWANRTSLTYK